MDALCRGRTAPGPVLVRKVVLDVHARPVLTLASGAVLSATTVAAGSKSNSSLSGYILPIIILVLVVFFIVNSRRRQKAISQTRQQQQDEWGPGTEIVTRAGMIATIVERHDDHVVLEVAPGVRTRYVPEAIGKRWYPEDEIPEPSDPEHTELPPAPDDRRLAD
jgi:preprotein translocase subunit YajC